MHGTLVRPRAASRTGGIRRSNGAQAPRSEKAEAPAGYPALRKGNLRSRNLKVAGGPAIAAIAPSANLSPKRSAGWAGSRISESGSAPDGGRPTARAPGLYPRAWLPGRSRHNGGPRPRASLPRPRPGPEMSESPVETTVTELPPSRPRRPGGPTILLRGALRDSPCRAGRRCFIRVR